MKSKVFSAIFFLILSVVLILIWFKDGFLYGGGDVGLPSYNPIRILEIVKNVWWEASAPGFPLIYGITATPFYFVLSILQIFNLNPVAIQMTLFGVLLFLMGFGVYLVADDYWSGKNTKASLLSACMYIFSPFLMVQVWHRFVHTAIYLAAALPFLFLFWKKWILFGRRKDLIIFAAISVLSAIIFSTLGFIIAFWLFMLFFVLCEIFIPWKGKKEVVTIIVRSSFGIVSWLSVSLWWLLPVVFTVPTVLSQQHSTSESISALLALSNQSVIPNVLQGVNPFYLFQEKEWGDIYTDPFFLALPWLIVIISLLGVIKVSTDKSGIFWGLLFVFAIFISKGAAPPFGNLFLNGFSNFFWLGVLRNPYEKLGILIPLSQAILVPIGIGFAYNFFKNKTVSKIILIICILAIAFNIFIWSWPFWLGKMFGNADYSAKVSIPDFYREADEWLKKQVDTDPGVILHLPLTAGEAVAYSQEGGGYQGAEPSQLLFSAGASVSHGFNLKTVDQYLQTLQMMIRHIDLFDVSKIDEILKSLNVKFIVVHSDILTTNRDIDNPERIKSLIQKIPFITKQAEFGPKAIYKIESESNGMIYLQSKFDYFFLGKDNQLWPWVMKSPDSILVSENFKDETSLISNAENVIIAPYISFNTPPNKLAYKENLWGELPPVRFLPSSQLYPLIKIKEWLETNSVYGRDRLIRKINFSSKRLVEAYNLQLRNSSSEFNTTLKEYVALINDIFPRLEENLPFEKPVLETIFTRHILAIEEIENHNLTELNREELTNAKTILKKYLVKLGFYPYFDLIDDQMPVSDRKVYEFDIEFDGEYYLAITDSSNHSDESRSFQVDNQIYTKNGIRYPSFIVYGPFFLRKGLHEVSGNMKLSSILDNTFDTEVEILENKNNIDATSKEYSLPEVTSGYFYRISFDYWIQKGDGISVQIEQDTDIVKRNIKMFDFNKFYGGDNYEKYWRGVTLSFKPKENSVQANLRFVVEPWNNCINMVSAKSQKLARKLCQNKEIRQQYQRPGKVAIKNLKIVRLIEPQAFLLSKMPSTLREKDTITYIKYEKISPVSYKGGFEISKPAFLVFSQTYDQGWKLIIRNDKGNVYYPEKSLVNLFANGWRVNDPGKYEFELIYTPQTWVNKGIVLGLVLLLTALLVYDRLKKKNIV